MLCLKTKKLISLILISVLIICLITTGCSKIGEKNTSLSFIYGATSVLSILLFLGYCVLLKQREKWFLFLFSSVCVVNIGYFWLSVSRNIDEALLANRVSYLGSVFLPLAMLMIILNLTSFKYNRRILWILIPITIVIFLIAASPGYLDIYYSSVTFKKIDGVSVLCKVYGPFHKIYLFYLLSYFAVMIAVILHGKFSNKIKSAIHGAILLSAVFVNICVWLLEQLVDIGFEFLSVSYIISELFLLGLYLFLQDNENARNALSEHPTENSFKSITKTNAKQIPTSANTDETEDFNAHCMYIKQNLHRLTPTERAIYNMYLEGKGTKEILKHQDITENTLKYHNKNIYSKLWVSSRKQLVEYSIALKNIDNNS